MNKSILTIGIICLFILSVLSPIVFGYTLSNPIKNISIRKIGDKNDKLYIDLVTRNIGYDDDITVYLGNGDGTFGNRRDYYIGEEPRQFAAGDFDNDFNLDLVITNLDKNYLSFLYGYGNGTFQDAQNYYVGHNTYAVFPYDLNSDGNLDLALANINHNNLSIMLGNGDGTFTVHYECFVGSGPSRILGEDLDNDGNIDLIITILYNTYLCIFFGYGNGTFGPRIVIPNGGPSLFITSGDFNNDDFMDFALTRGCISVFLNQKNGTFHREDYPSGASYIAGISTGDFNNDGILDLASTERRNYPDYRVRILFGNGNGTFGNEKYFSTGNGVSSIVSKDFNGDHNIDLAVLHGAADDIRIYFGDGTGNFSSAVIYPVGRSPRWLLAECFRTAPFVPTIDGPTSGSIGELYFFTFNSTDPNGYNVSYYIDWGDGSVSDWSYFQPSGYPGYIESHRWLKSGKYTIKVKARNILDIESSWSELQVTMPRNKIATNTLILRIFEQFPILERFFILLTN